MKHVTTFTGKRMRAFFALCGIASLSFGSFQPVLAGEEGGGDIPEEIRNWDSPYETPADLLNAFNTAQDSGTCWEYMNTKYDLIVDETRYWGAVATPDSEGDEYIDRVMQYLLQFQLALGKNRLELEKLSGKVKQCEGNADISNITDPLEILKIKMRFAGYYIDNGDSRELTEEMVEKRCEKATELTKELGGLITHLTEKLNERVESGEMDGIANAKELLNMVQVNYGNASAALKRAQDASDLEEHMRECSGAMNEAEVGMDLFNRARSFNSGKNEDDSDPVEEIDAKIKLFLSFIAEKRVDVLARQSDDREAILTALASAEQKIVEVQIAFAQVKYTDDPDLGVFDDLLEQIKMELRAVIDLLDSTEAEAVTKRDRRESLSRLMEKARKQMKELNEKLENKEDDADTDEEEDILQFVEQTLAIDAVHAKQAAAAFRGEQEYADAQAQAFTAIQLAKTGNQTLGAIE